MPDGDGPVAARFAERMRAEEERRLAPEAVRSLRDPGPARSRRRSARCGRRSSATATGSCTRRRSGG